MKTDMKYAGVLGVSALLIIFYGLSFIAPWRSLLQWLLQAGLLWCWVWWEAWRRHELNRSHVEASPLARLGLANRLTLLRGYLIAFSGGFLFQPAAEGFIAWLPGLLYGVAAILDRLDGFIARRTQQTTLLGAELDTAFDALGLIVAPLLAVTYGKVHWSYLLLSLAYYIFQWGLHWRRRRGLPLYEILPSQLRRALAGFQMGFVAVALLPWFHASQTLICSLAFMIPALLGFAVDWLVASGRIRTRAGTAPDFFSQFTEFRETIFQPTLRVFIAISVLFMIGNMELPQSLMASNILLMSGLLVGSVLVLFCCAGRVGALLIVLLLSSHPLVINGLNTTILCGSVGLLLLGTGRYSLWQWDDLWVNRQGGAE